MRWVLNVDGETPQDGLYYVTVHRDECAHAVRNDVRRERRYWVRGPLKNLGTVRARIDHEIQKMHKEHGKKLTPRACKRCQPGHPR
jgi:hypothetical protein